MSDCILETGGCPVRPVLDHTIDVFKRADLKGFILESYKAAEGESEDAHPDLSVA